MNLLFIFAATGIFISCKATNHQSKVLDDDIHPHHASHQHYHADGGPLLGGYPWGVFALQMQFDDRLDHEKNNQEMTLSNRIFESLGIGNTGEAMVAFPLSLDHKNYNPFGDGQSNGHADFAAWTQMSPPYIAIYRPDSGNGLLLILLHKDLNFGNSQSIDWLLNSNTSQVAVEAIPSEFPTSIKADYTKIAKVSVTGTNWNKMTGGAFGFFKPTGWSDWFAIHFQNPYVSIDQLVTAVPQQFASFSVGNEQRSIPNPTKASTTTAVPPVRQLMSIAGAEDYLVFSNDKVHSLYPQPNTPETVEKTVGGNWTFLLKPDKWENGSPPDTFKQLYSCFPGRMYWEESIKKAISGTSWHHVGDPGEFLLNSIESESRSLVTALGVKVPDSALPSLGGLAYNLQYVGYSGFLKPGEAFISVKGQFHWHPVHTVTPVCIEVWRPFCDVTETNKFGMECSGN